MGDVSHSYHHDPGFDCPGIYVINMFSIPLSQNEQLVSIHRKAESSLIRPVLIVMACVYAPIWYLIKYGLIHKFIWILAIWTLIVLIYGLKSYLSWLLNSYIITTQRVIHASYKVPFGKSVREMMLSSIENITVNTPGLWSHLTRTGEVEILGAGEISKIVFLNVRDPIAIKEEIWKMKKGF